MNDRAQHGLLYFTPVYLARKQPETEGASISHAQRAGDSSKVSDALNTLGYPLKSL